MAKDQDAALRQQLIELIKGGNAHADFNKVIEDFPAELRGKRPKGAPHSAWQLLEHLRLAQWDILDFSRNAAYKPLKWPVDYWPEQPEPANAGAWDESINAFRKDMDAMCALVGDQGSDLYALFALGDGQNLLREAMLVADHNAYHLGQLVLLRRVLGAWAGE